MEIAVAPAQVLSRKSHQVEKNQARPGDFRSSFKENNRQCETAAGDFSQRV